MGIKTSRTSRPHEVRQDRLGSWVTIETCPEEVLKYNPVASYAVCAGVGTQLHLGKEANLGAPADNDAEDIQRVLTSHLGWQKDHTKLLNSDGNHATAANIKNTLSAFSQNVGRDGILLLHFSGHCLQLRTGHMILVPADYRPDQLDTTISIQDIILAVGNTKPRYFLLIVDCCHARKIADDFVVNLECEIPVYILASCSSQQKSLSFKTLKNGLFTYFLVNYLKHFVKTGNGRFPTQAAIQYAKSLLQAMELLLSPGFDGPTTMSPELVFCQKVWSMPEDSTMDEVDATSLGPRYIEFAEQHNFAMKYLRKQPEMPALPSCVTSWLVGSAWAALDQLKQAEVLHKPEMRTTVLSFMTQSVVSLLIQEYSQRSTAEAILQDNMCVSLFLHMSELLQHVDVKLRFTLEDMERCIMSYIHKVKKLLQLENGYQDQALTQLVALLHRVHMDVQRASRESARPLEDEVDKGKSGFAAAAAEDETDAGKDNVDSTDISLMYIMLEDTATEQHIPVIPPPQDM